MIVSANLFLAMASVASASCTYLPPAGDHDWIPGNYKAQPVMPTMQNEAMSHLKWRSVMPIDRASAKKLTGNSELPPAKFFYLAKAGYVGGAGDPSKEANGISLSVDVDSQRTAFITSYRLTYEKGSTQYSVVIASPIAIKKVVAICGSAK